MRQPGASYRPVAAGALLALLGAAPPLAAQVDVKVTVPTLQDSRTRIVGSDRSGGLVLFTKLEGAGVEQAKAFRIRVTGAKDDAGREIPVASDQEPDWADSTSDSDLWIKLKSPARDAASVTVTGRLEVFVPSNDPAALVKVENVFARGGKPLVSPALAAAQLEVAVAPPDTVSEGNFSFVSTAAGMERIKGVQVLKRDGTPVETSFSQSGSDGETAQFIYRLGEPAPPDAGVLFTVLTEKAVVSIPFELKGLVLP